MTQGSTSLVVQRPRSHDIVVCTEGEDGWRDGGVLGQGFWAVPNPAQPRVAVSRVAWDDEGGGHSRVEVVDRTGDVLQVAFESSSGDPAVIAPGIPHYCYWSPRGNYLAFAVARRNAFEVFIADAAGGARSVARGAPIFMAWSPDERFLAMHAGSRVEVYDLHEGVPLAPIEKAAGFRNPVFLDATTVLFGRTDGSKVTLTALSLPDMHTTDLQVFPGGVSVSVQPGTRRVFVGLSRDPESGSFDGLWHAEVESPTRVAGDWELAVRGPFVAQLWSPTGEHLVQAVPLQTGDGRYVLRALSGGTTPSAWTEPFLPSNAYRSMLTFFDQYALSHPVWSRDGDRVFLFGMLAREGVHPSFGDVPARAFAWRPEPGAPLEYVTEAEIGAVV